MKKTILIMFVLCLPLAFALYGGETWKYHFDECDSLEVNITAIDIIDEGEYTILNNCTKNDTNYYICDCNDDYYFNVTFKVNAVNNYTFDFNYAYSEFIEEQTSGGGGSSRGSYRKTKGCIPDWNCTKWGDCQPNNRAVRTCNDLNKCDAKKPSEERYCYYYVPKGEVTPMEEPEEEREITEQVESPIEKEPEKKGIALGWKILIIIVLVIIAILSTLYVVTRKEF